MLQCYALISMGVPLAPDTCFLRGTNNKNTLLVSKVVNININEIKISGPWRWDEQPRSKWTWSNGRRLTACVANLRRSLTDYYTWQKTNIKLNKCSNATLPLWTTIKHRKNCESCPTQVTWKIKSKSQICLFSLTCLSCLSCESCLSCLSCLSRRPQWQWWPYRPWWPWRPWWPCWPWWPWWQSYF